MSDIVVKHNTKTKSLEVSVDDKKLKNVHSINFENRNLSPYSGDRYEKDKADTYGCRIGMANKDEENGTVHHTHIMASLNTEEAQRAVERGVAHQLPELPDFVIIRANNAEASDIVRDILDYFKKK